MTAPSAGLTAPARDAVVACLLAPQNVPDVLLDRRRRRAVGAGESTVTLTASTTVSLAASPELKAFTLLRPFDDARRAASLDVRGRGGGKSRAAKKRKDETRRAVVTLRGSASSDSGNDAGSGEEGTGEDIDITADDVSQAWFPRTPTREAKAPLETTRTTPTTTRASSSRRHARRSPTPMSTRRAHDATNASVSSSSSVVSHPRARTSSGDVASSFSRRTVRDGGTGAKSLASRRSGSRGGSEVQPSSAPELPPIRVSSASAGGIGSVLAQGAKFLVGAPSQSAHVIRYREGK
jgi:hypothetical protein